MNFCLKNLEDSWVHLNLITLHLNLMIAHFFFALTTSEMGLSPTIIALIVVSSIVFIVGLQKAQERMNTKN